jgi:hypothetical protein
VTRNLQVDADLDGTDRTVRDESGGPSPLALSRNRVSIGSMPLPGPALLQVTGGQMAVSHPGDGNVLLTLGTERSWVFKQLGTGKATALELTAANPNNNNKNFIINTDGGVGIGTRTPRSTLDVNGSITVSEDIVLHGADCAEDFDIEDGSEVEAGTVMVIAGRRTLRHSSRAYDHRVAGIVTGAGSLRPGIVLGRRDRPGPSVAVALTGTAYCRVDASAHPIRLGDMLTTSDRPGHAMSAVDREQSFGAVIGKSLGELARGVGLVPMLVALQ